MGANLGVGRYGENVAARYLESRGMTIVERNWRCSQGEIDIVALEGQVVAVVEVKTRRSDRFGSPFEAIDARKSARLRRLAALWLRSPAGERIALAVDPRRFVGAGMSRIHQVRIDAVGVLLPGRGAAVVRHLRGVA